MAKKWSEMSVAEKRAATVERGKVWDRAGLTQEEKKDIQNAVRAAEIREKAKTDNVPIPAKSTAPTEPPAYKEGYVRLRMSDGNYEYRRTPKTPDEHEAFRNELDQIRGQAGGGQFLDMRDLNRRLNAMMEKVRPENERLSAYYIGKIQAAGYKGKFDDAATAMAEWQKILGEDEQSADVLADMPGMEEAMARPGFEINEDALALGEETGVLDPEEVRARYSENQRWKKVVDKHSTMEALLALRKKLVRPGEDRVWAGDYEELSPGPAPQFGGTGTR